VARASSRLQQPIGEINLTPLIDLTFLLLITFVITFPMVQSGIPVRLPKGRSADLPVDGKRTVTLDAGGKLYLDERPCSFAQLASDLKVLGRTAPDTTILVRGDERVAYGKVMEVLRLLHESGLAKMSLVTQADKPSRRR